MSNIRQSIIEVDLIDEGKVATIVMGSNNNPQLYVHKADHEVELQALLTKLRGQELPVHLAPKKEHDQGKWTISDRYKNCVPGDEGYEYALAHELSHHRLSGKIMRGVVKHPA